MTEDGLDRTDLRSWMLEGTEVTDLDIRLADAARALSAGRPVIHPTETVYGVGSDLSHSGVTAVRRAKSRTDDKPVLALIPDLESVRDLRWTDEARELARVFWPGAVTLVVADPEGVFPDGVRSPAGTVALRWSSHPIAAALVRALGAPMTSSSANRPGNPAASTSSAAERFAKDLASADALRPHFVDAGDLPASAPSTLVDCTGSVPVVLREGAVPVHRLRCALPGLVESGAAPARSDR